MTFDLTRQTHPKAPRFKDHTGKTYGWLTALHFSGNQSAESGRATAVWACNCICGSIVGVPASALTSGNTRSCGCRKLLHEGAEPQHGMSYTPEYMAWKSLRNRCLNPKAREYPRYGGRGISVCPEWIASFEAFFDHVGPRPSAGHSIDRIDNNGNYEPGNVRWATIQVQNANRSCCLKYKSQKEAA